MSARPPGELEAGPTLERDKSAAAAMTGWQRHPRIAFLLLGIVVTALCGLARVFWFDVANGMFGLGVSYDTRPAWLRGIMSVVTWLPAVILALAIIGRVRRGRVYRPLAFVAGAVSVYLLALGLLLFGPALSDHRHRTAFDAANWRANARADPMYPARLTMVDDLLARGLLERATRDSVTRLLGPRDSTSYFQEWELVYWLGPERGLIRIDSEWLVIAFGADDRVSAARIVTD